MPDPEQEQHELKPTIGMTLDLDSAKALYDMLKQIQGIADLLGAVQIAYNAHTMAVELKRGIDNMLLSKNKTNQRKSDRHEETFDSGPFAPGLK